VADSDGILGTVDCCGMVSGRLFYRWSFFFLQLEPSDDDANACQHDGNQFEMLLNPLHAVILPPGRAG